MVDDSRAFGMTEMDWYLESLSRFMSAVAAALAFGLATYWLNGAVLEGFFKEHTRVRLGVSGGLAAIVILPALAGSIQFVLTKPYM